MPAWDCEMRLAGQWPVMVQGTTATRTHVLSGNFAKAGTRLQEAFPEQAGNVQPLSESYVQVESKKAATV